MNYILFLKHFNIYDSLLIIKKVIWFFLWIVSSMVDFFNLLYFAEIQEADVIPYHNLKKGILIWELWSLRQRQAWLEINAQDISMQKVI